MKPTLFLFFLIVVSNLSCDYINNAESNVCEYPVDTANLETENQTKEDSWYDKLVLKFINNTNSPLIKLAIEEGISESWILDRTETSNSAKYLIFQIGHHVSDSGNTDPRFVTDGWLYIDSLTRKVYEYDLPNEQLVEWVK